MPFNQTTFKKGHKRSLESRLKQAKTMQGKVNKLAIERMNTPEVNIKKAHRGENHPKWIIDRSKVKFRPRYEMTLWTKAVFERDDYVCQECGQKGYKLQAHHIKPYASYPELRWKLNNGKTLCIECHKKTDTYAKNIKYQIHVPIS